MAYAVSDIHTLDKPILQSLDTVSTTQDGGLLGQERLSRDGRKYKYVVTEVTCVASAAGEPAYYMVGTTSNEVTSDFTNATVNEKLGAAFAGVFCGTIAATTVNYCWIEIPNGGLTADASCATEVGANDGLIATDDSYFSISSSDSDHIVAVAMEGQTNNLADIIMIG